ncbi:MAG: GNAT family N-acetyltransferase [Myxococcota bacterium]
MTRSAASELRTERLRLRRFCAEDLEPFAALNADPRVMRYLLRTLSRDESDALAARIEEHFEAHGFGNFAVEVAADSAFAGFVGLSVPRFAAPFMPCVEIGWRLATRFQGRGYATEGARAALALGFGRLGLEEIVSFTVPANRASWQVMEKLGMTRDPAEDFDHPMIPEAHPLHRHVLYRLGAQAWRHANGRI